MNNEYKIMVEYTCDGCGERIYIDINDECCPKCGFKNPNCKTVNAKCDVCGNVALTDQYGNGTCEKCGWKINVCNREYPDSVQYPNIVSLNKAKRLYEEGKPLLPSFNDFVEGLLMYSEMEFTYKNRDFGVYLTGKNHGNLESGVEIFECNTDKYQQFSSIKDFKNNASIDGKVLKDIWKDVTNARYDLF